MITLVHFLPVLGPSVSHVLPIAVSSICIVERGCKVHSPVKLACGESSAKFREDPKWIQYGGLQFNPIVRMYSFFADLS